MASHLERNLRDLDALHEKALINADEYRLRRNALVASVSAEGSGTDGAVMGLGVLGLLVGLFFGWIAIVVGSVGNSVDSGTGNEVIGLGISAMAAVAVGGLVAIGVAINRVPSWGSYLIGVCALWHLVSISLFGVPAFALLLLCAILAWWQRNEI